MEPERWKRLKPLFHGALDQPADRRAEWLRQACPDDEALRREAQALVDAHQTAGDFLDSPATLAPHTPTDDPPPLASGHQLGPYVIRGELGRGGMGIVYLAEDVRLGRTVALKALPSSLAQDATRRERLRREARAAAALSDPGIATVYALEEIAGDLFIAAEHVRGHTLETELADGALEFNRALDTTIDLARALCAAHEAGIVHRDLKPENIIRTADGRIKILDFGIAQFVDQTLTQLTMPGGVLGTPAYMAPEQLAGGDVDARADQYALGVLIVRMATGVHPFATGASERPMPEGLKAIADRCLARDPRDRYRSMRDVLAAVEALRNPLARSVSGTFSPRWWWEFHQGVAALVYWLMTIPVWTARGVIGGLTGRAIFVVSLAAIIVAANLRLHLWFTSHFYPRELPWVRRRTAKWIATGDWVFVLTLVAAGLLVGDERAALAVLLFGVGMGTAVFFLFVEPVTERATFDEGTP
jgi:hypothetical protein